MNQNLRQETVKGTFWSTLERFSSLGVNFVLGLIIARFLTPAEYGIVAVLTIFLTLSTVFIDSGFSSALIRKEDRTETDNSTVFYFNIAVGFSVYAILYVSVPFIAELFDNPLLVPTLRIVSFSLIINSFSLVQYSILVSRIDFKTEAKISFISAAVSGIIGVIIAYFGFGVWALVLQIVVASFLRCVLLWVMIRWFPSMPFSKSSFNEMFFFASKLFVSSFLVTLNQNFYTFVLGKVSTQATLGLYSRANQIAQFPAFTMISIVQKVTLPVLSRIQKDKEAVSQYILNSLRITTWIVFPAMALICILSKPFILLMLGEKWIEAVVPLQILCIAQALIPIYSININLLTINGNSGYILQIGVIRFVLNILTLFILFQYGLYAVCLGQVFSSFVTLIIYFYYSNKAIGLDILRQVSSIYSNLIIVLLCSILSAFSIEYIDNNIGKILVGLIVFIGCYLMVSYKYKKSCRLILSQLIKFRNYV